MNQVAIIEEDANHVNDDTDTRESKPKKSIDQLTVPMIAEDDETKNELQEIKEESSKQVQENTYEKLMLIQNEEQNENVPT